MPSGKFAGKFGELLGKSKELSRKSGKLPANLGIALLRWGWGEVKGGKGLGHVELKRKKGSGARVGAGVGTAKGICRLLL